MPKRIATRLSELESISPPVWLPVTEYATWRRLPINLKRVLTGAKPASYDEVVAILAACDEAKRQRVIELLTRG